MPKYDQKRTLYLTADEELKTRLDLAYAAAKKGRKGFYMKDFLEFLIRDGLDRREEFIGSRAALANRVGERLSARMDNFQIVLWAIFHLLCVKFNIAAELRTEALLWAVQHQAALEQRIAELRNIPSVKQDTTVASTSTDAPERNSL